MVKSMPCQLLRIFTANYTWQWNGRTPKAMLFQKLLVLTMSPSSKCLKSFYFAITAVFSTCIKMGFIQLKVESFKRKLMFNVPRPIKDHFWYQRKKIRNWFQITDKFPTKNQRKKNRVENKLKTLVKNRLC